MNSRPLQFLGFDDDNALGDLLVQFKIFTDYKLFLSEHLTEIIRKEHPNAELHSIRLLGKSACSIDGMSSPDNFDNVIVGTMKIPLDLMVRLSTNGTDLHDLTITLEINADDVQSSPKVTTNMFVRNHVVVSSGGKC